jgi:hypothetical protein
MFNAFESTNDFGGIGISLRDRQDMSEFMRHLSTENFMDDKDMSQILSGALDQKLLKSVSDVKGFKKKFTDIVDSVKQITLTMNQTIDEATSFMGEMERRGITQDRMTSFSSQSKVLSSIWGVSANQGAQQLFAVTDSITQGTGIKADTVANSYGYMAFLGGKLEDRYKASGDTMYNYIMNNGGSAQLTGGIEQRLRSYTMSSQGSALLEQFLAGSYDKTSDGKLTMNATRLQDMLSGKYTPEQLENMSANFNRSLTPEQLFTLQNQVSTDFNNNAKNGDLLNLASNVLGDKFKAVTGAKDVGTALLSLGIAQDSNQAEIIKQLIKMSQNPEYARVMNATVQKEKDDSALQAGTPGFGKQMQYFFKGLMEPFANFGQDINDGIGTASESYNKFMNGINDNSIVGGDTLDTFSNDTLKKYLRSGGLLNELNKDVSDYAASNSDSSSLMSSTNGQDARRDVTMNQAQKEIQNAKKSKLADHSKEFTQGEEDYWLNEVRSGKAKPSDIKKLKALRSQKGLSNIAKMRLDHVLSYVDGSLDGPLGKIGEVTSSIMMGVADFMASDTALDRLANNVWDFVSGDNASTKKVLDDANEKLRSQKSSLNKQLESILQGDLEGVSDDELDELEKHVQAGDEDAVRKITGNSKVLSLAKKYKSLNRKVSANKKGYTDLETFTRQTAATAKMGQGLYGFIKQSGAFDGEDALLEKTFGDYRDYSNRMLDDLKKGRLTQEEMIEESSRVIEGGKGAISNLSKARLKEVAESLVNNNIVDGIGRVETNGKIDSDKVFNAIAEMVRAQQAPNINDDQTSSDKKVQQTSKQATEKADQHVAAMNSFLSAVMKETKNMHEAVQQMKTGNYKYTSVG